MGEAYKKHCEICLRNSFFYEWKGITWRLDPLASDFVVFSAEQSFDYFQVYMTELEDHDEDVVLPEKEIIINQALLRWEERDQEIMKDENIKIFNLEIGFSGLKNVPEDLEFSDSLKNSLKKIRLLILENAGESAGKDAHTQADEAESLIKLVQNLPKDVEVSISTMNCTFKPYVIKNFPKGIELSFLDETDESMGRAENASLFFLSEGDYFELTAKELYFAKKDGYDPSQTPGYIVLNNSESCYLTGLKDFEAVQLSNEEVDSSIKNILDESPEHTVVMPNSKLSICLEQSENETDGLYPLMDISLLFKSSFSMNEPDSSYNQSRKEFEDFLEKSKILNEL